MTVKELRANGPACGSSACAAGETVIQFAPLSTRFKLLVFNSEQSTLSGKRIHKMAQKLLGLTAAEARYAFQGGPFSGGIFNVSKEKYVTYLDKAIANKNMMVSVGW